MPEFTWTPRIVADYFDKNNDGFVSDNMKMSADVKQILDTNKDGKVSVDELAAGIEKDKVVITSVSGNIFKAPGKLAVTTACNFSDKIADANEAIYRAQKDIDTEDLTLGAKSMGLIHRTSLETVAVSIYFAAYTFSSGEHSTSDLRRAAVDVERLTNAAKQVGSSARFYTRLPREVQSLEDQLHTACAPYR